MSLEQLTLSDEQVQDIVGSLITGGGGSDVVYDDANDTLTVSLSDSISVNTLEATGSITDAANVNHTGELADIGDTSSIQSSGDVTVTDTQPGAVNNGEFLTNSGGSLTGGTVETEPNVPAWEESSNSPRSKTNVSPNNQFDMSLPESADIRKFFVEMIGGANTQNISLLINNTTEYTYKQLNGSETSGSSFLDIGQIESGAKRVTEITVSDNTNGFGVIGSVNNIGLAGNFPTEFVAEDASSVNSIQIEPGADFGDNIDVVVRAYYLDV